MVREWKSTIYLNEVGYDVGGKMQDRLWNKLRWLIHETWLWKVNTWYNLYKSMRQESIGWGVLMALLNWKPLGRVGVKLEREEEEKGVEYKMCGIKYVIT